MTIPAAGIRGGFYKGNAAGIIFCADSDTGNIFSSVVEYKQIKNGGGHYGTEQKEHKGQTSQDMRCGDVHRTDMRSDYDHTDSVAAERIREFR